VGLWWLCVLGSQSGGLWVLSISKLACLGGWYRSCVGFSIVTCTRDRLQHPLSFCCQRVRAVAFCVDAAAMLSLCTTPVSSCTASRAPE